MSCSDNVVRAGLTPKPKDVETYIKMLTFREGVEPLGVREVDTYTTRYQPPIDEFCLDRICLPPQAHFSLPTLNSPSILLVFEGQAELEFLSSENGRIGVGRGSVLLIGSNVNVQCKVGGESGCVLFRCFCSVGVS